MPFGRLYRRLSSRTLITQFLRFALVGALGLLWDTGTVYLLRPFTGLAAAMLAAYFIAATINWLLNRFWTFRGIATERHIMLQWLRFIAANSAGFFLNRGTAFTLCFLSPLCVRYPVIPLAAGAAAGMTANFNLSRRLVFREPPPESARDLVARSIEIPALHPLPRHDDPPRDL